MTNDQELNNLIQALQIEGDIPFQTGGFAGVAVQTLIFLVIDLVLYPIFGALGGLIGVN